MNQEKKSDRKSIWQSIKTLITGDQTAAGVKTGSNGHFMPTEPKDFSDSVNTPRQAQERTLIDNVKNVSQLTAQDVMVPRVDIIAFDIDTPIKEVLYMLADKPLSRTPVYDENLDNIIGCLHIKDVVMALAQDKPLNLRKSLRDVMMISPTMRALDLLLEMRETQTHLALVVDEFGGVDGLVTIADLVEAIVGEIKDEHDEGELPRLLERQDGTVLVDGRYPVEDMEERFGSFLSEEEREDVDTVAGLCMTLSGQMPVRGEILRHETGLEMEVVSADPRHVKQVRIHTLPHKDNEKRDKTAD